MIANGSRRVLSSPLHKAGDNAELIRRAVRAFKSGDRVPVEMLQSGKAKLAGLLEKIELDAADMISLVVMLEGTQEYWATLETDRFGIEVVPAGESASFKRITIHAPSENQAGDEKSEVDFASFAGDVEPDAFAHHQRAVQHMRQHGTTYFTAAIETEKTAE